MDYLGGSGAGKGTKGMLALRKLMRGWGLKLVECLCKGILKKPNYNYR